MDSSARPAQPTAGQPTTASRTLLDLVDAAIEQRTLAALAADAGCSPQAVWNWRTGRGEMGRKLYLGIQRALGLSAQEMADAWAAAETVLAGRRVPPGLR
jgi:hypothetical protein